jgi:Fuc2NAc and GlcNAc transferase
MAVLLALLLALGLGWIPTNVGIAIVGGGACIALMGWLDDHHGLAARVRVAAQLLAAVWAVVWLGIPTELVWGTDTVRLGMMGLPLAILTIIWFTNLFNFMDGIDGLAAGQAITMGGLGAVLLTTNGATGLALIGLICAASSAGFLIWNWSPARIFMGDVGSCFLGYSLATLAIAADRAGSVPALAWVILGGLFLFDATATLIRRVARGEKWYTAHRSHAYQRAVQSGLSHKAVTLLAMGINVGLFGLAWFGTRAPASLPMAMGVAFVVLAALYLAVGRRRPMWSLSFPAEPGEPGRDSQPQGLV